MSYSLVSSRWTGQEEWRAARFACGLELHQFDPNPFVIVQIELPFSISTNLRLRMPGRQAVSLIEKGDRFFHVLDAERKVIEHTESLLRHRRGNPGFFRIVYQHVFEPIGAVRDLLG